MATLPRLSIDTGKLAFKFLIKVTSLDSASPSVTGLDMAEEWDRRFPLSVIDFLRDYVTRI